MATIAISLCTVMALELPVQVYASTLPEKETPTYSSFDAVSGEEETVGNIVSEDTSERSEYTKTFNLDDGTKMLAQYEEPVHFKDENGKWQEYDNSLSSTDNDKSNDLSNQDSDVKITLADKAETTNMVSVETDGYTVSWGYDDIESVSANEIADDTKLSGNDEFTTLTNATSEVKYEDAFKNVDFQYIITTTGLKENIILKNSDVQNDFYITYNIGELTPVQADDTTISLQDKNGKEVYSISAPYMTDAEGNSSNSLKLTIEKHENSTLQVKLSVDYWFVHSWGRQFPITIDPQISKKLSSDMSMYSTSGSQAYTYGPFTNASSANTIVKMNTLPTLASGEQIVSAKFNFEALNGSTLFESESDSAIVVNAHKVLTLGNEYTYSSDVLDYDTLTYNDNTNLEFDLTKTFKDWYSNGDEIDGFVIESASTVGSKTVTFQSATRTSVTPAMTIIYKDFSGTEDNLEYHTVALGQTTNISVGNYLGNLIVSQSLYDSTGTKFPLSIGATYNSINTAWQMSFDQSVSATTQTLANNGYDYIYTDSDGTDHYLTNSDTEDEWRDEDDLGITVTVNDENLTLDNGSTTQTYQLPANGGKLLSEKDSDDNTITYTYDSGNLTAITDSYNRSTTLSYTNSKLTSISLPNSNTVTFSYSGDNLTQVKLADDTAVNFLYNDNNELTAVEQGYYDGSTFNSVKTLQFTLSNSKVTQIAEYGSDMTAGNYLNIAYNTDNTTVFTDRQGRTETHTFNNYGETISVLNANGYLTSAGSDLFSISSGSDSYTKNYITQSTEFTEIGNGNYYYITNGSKDNSTSSGGTVTVDNSSPTEDDGYYQYFGTTSLQVENPVSEDNSAFYTGATHQFDTSFNGQTVTFSAYVKTNNVAQIYSGGAVGAMLKLVCFDSSNNVIDDENSIGITGTQDWQRLSVTADIPDNTSYFRVYCNLRYASGTAWFDCLQLEDGDCANDFNALQNSDFSSGNNWLNEGNNGISVNDGTATINGVAGVYENAELTTSEDSNTEETTATVETYTTSVTETEPVDSVYTYDDDGNLTKTEQGFVTREVVKTYEVEDTESNETSDTDDTTSTDETDEEVTLGNKYIYQNVAVNRAGVSFNIYGEAMAKSVPLTNSNRTFGIALNIYYEGETTPEMHYQEFNADTSARQSISTTVTPYDYTKTINYVAFAFVYGYNENEMTAYNAMLNISSSNVAIESETSDDTSNDADDTDDEEDTEYDDYIDYEVTSESVDKSQTFMQTSSEYDSLGNVTSEVDEAGNTVAYAYDSNSNITSITDGEENVVNYTYNSKNQLTSISSGNAENTYSYAGNNVLSIGHNGFSYDFSYDVFDNVISTEIGDVALSTNTYSANNGNLTRTTYANGDYIEYTYDDYDNIIKLDGENGTIAKFVYNKKGQIAKSIDVSGGKTTYYYYDFSGSLIGQYAQTENGSLQYIIGTDTNGNSFEQLAINGQTKTITSGTDSDGNEFVSNDTVNSNQTTDSFGRITNVNTTYGDNDAYLTSYEYADGSVDNSTTNTVSKITQMYGDRPLVTYEYEYDGNGNITKVYINNELANKYTYDSLNQIKTEYDYVNGFYINYSYDNAGNIQSANTQYLNSDNEPYGSPYGNVYYYNDTEWKDKLTKINATNITYDESGNPLSYRNGMTFEWENGRQLKQITTSESTILMNYDSNGMRTKKQVGNTATNYYYDSNNNLVGMTKGNDVLFFYFDTDNAPVAMKLNGTMYFYIKNLQGDIVKIIDTSGVTVAGYVYDAWGNITSTTGNNTLSTINPFRYRGYVYDDETGLYYLQSRYYDPVTGRFLNADAYFDTGSGTPLSTNMFAYCENNALKYTDKNGYFAIVDDVVYLALIIMAAASVLLISSIAQLVTSEQFINSWRNFCNSVGNGLQNIGTAIWNGVGSLINTLSHWSAKAIYYVTSQIKQYATLDKADSKIRSTVRKEARTRYWSATLKKGYVSLGKPLTRGKAISYVRSGRSVFTVTKTEAYDVAKYAYGGKQPVGPETDKGKEGVRGYYRHYHVYKRKNNAHVWFLFG